MRDDFDQMFNQGGYVPKFSVWEPPPPPPILEEEEEPKFEGWDWGWIDTFLWRAVMSGLAAALWMAIFGAFFLAGLQLLGAT